MNDRSASHEDLRAVIARVERLLAARGPMTHEEVVPLDCNAHLVLYGPDGAIKEERRAHNLICTAGREQVLLYTAAKTLSQFAYMAVGTNATAANIADTTLGTEIARSTIITPTNPTADILSFAFTWAAGAATGALTEIGMLDAASVGHLLNHLVFSVVNKASGDSLVATVTFT